MRNVSPRIETTVRPRGPSAGTGPANASTMATAKTVCRFDMLRLLSGSSAGPCRPRSLPRLAMDRPTNPLQELTPFSIRDRVGRLESEPDDDHTPFRDDEAVVVLEAAARVRPLGGVRPLPSAVGLDP